MENALEKWDSMKQAIEEAKIVPEVSRIRDKAETTRHVLRLAGESPRGRPKGRGNQTSSREASESPQAWRSSTKLSCEGCMLSTHWDNMS